MIGCRESEAAQQDNGCYAELLALRYFRHAVGQMSGFIALVTGQGEQEVLQAFLRSSRLCRFGCVNPMGLRRVCPKICFFLDGLNDESLASSF